MVFVLLGDVARPELVHDVTPEEMTAVLKGMEARHG